ncbi:CheC domain protein [Paenibacillus curdlanolyticus YK9]|uniref:CheC domain protein n=1 Tax=Paenibacillus curdlanolyticus YK9 TaxID=717606 RepID=E0I6C1_9BACL|nr:chemotaxis protein CheX [Paenibacillus curdlanolyticus]EFM11587.1 CheC domain protein [Paenibacillus curdlanolyticus YK9]
MKAEYINPFLESAIIVIEQVAQVKPAPGKPGLKQFTLVENYIFIQIGIHGQVSGNIIFGISEQVAVKIVSAMMGGFTIAAIDEIGRSAISELGNMISGNASTLLYNQGVHVDITPPIVVNSPDVSLEMAKTLTIPLIMEGLGELDIQFLIAS